MVGGLYSAAAGMAAQQQWMDALSNDIANVDTDGYKKQRLAFRDLAYNQDAGVAIGAGSAVVDGGRSFAQGALQQTGESLNLAIDGPGFFQVRRADGTTGLTRSGNFQLDANGSIVTSSGERLMPPITVPKGTNPSQIEIGSDGTVSVQRKPIGKIAIVDVPAHSGLMPVGDSIFAPSAQSGAPTPVRSLLRQGFVEHSNVDMGDAMVDMIQAQRGFELQSRVIHVQDQLMEISNGIRR